MNFYFMKFNVSIYFWITFTSTCARIRVVHFTVLAPKNLFLIPKLVLRLVHGTKTHFILFVAHHSPEYQEYLTQWDARNTLAEMLLNTSIAHTTWILLLGCGVNSVRCISNNPLRVFSLFLISCFHA